jgi:histidinol-phosphatase (PHP family)
MNSRRKLSRRDGHTHTELCPHGSREATDSFIRRAIQLGFETYSLTEHPPLPKNFEDPTPEKSCGISWQELEPYLELARKIKRSFAGQIDIKVGLEVDYIPGYDLEIRQLLDTCGPDLDDALLSVHFLEGRGGWRCVDYSAEDFQEGLVDVYGSAEAVHQAYWSTVRQAVLADLGLYKPRRLGHLSLIHKYQRKHRLRNPQQFRPQILEILDLTKSRKMELDLNAAGLFKPDCQEIYPAPWIIEEAVGRGIPFVYGSDTHSVQGVGQGFKEAEIILSSFEKE